MKKKSLYWQIPLLVLLIVGTFFIARSRYQDHADENGKDSQAAANFIHNEGFMFDTVYRITYESDVDMHGEVERALNKVDKVFSMFNENSTVSCINRGENPELPPMYVEVYERAEQIKADTEGAFDVTVAPLVNAWGFGFKSEQMPTPAQVDSLLKIKNQLDYSAIAKGYGCDVAARALDSLGVKNYMIEVGGEVVTRGHNPEGKQWRIGITKPAEDVKSEIYAIMRVGDVAMATSGNYRNFYYKEGRKYAHTIDPRTGYPVQHELLSATVLAPKCTDADAYATSFMVLGLNKSKEVLKRHPEMKAYFIYTDEEGKLAVWHSPDMELEDMP